ncbi:MAG: DUF4390 domain-containing protein [Propionivibrio sp.]|nr:DUF4390 domain-containing protein [Propionivibrio sp.]
MRCCEKLFRAIFCSAALLLTALTTQAAEISIRNPQLEANEDGYALSADMNINFNTRLEEAVNRGIVLFFAADFELTRSRWYWLDEQVVRRSKIFRLSYHALTRQYRLSTGASALHQSYASLDEALSVMSHVRNWQVLEKDEVKPGQAYLASLRMRLDLSLMPKTFQVSALANRDWNLSSEWLRWDFMPSELKQEPPPAISTPATPSANPHSTPASGTPPASPATPAAGEGK